jgi:formylglycine-generating enzyme required for sulfatase activity
MAIARARPLRTLLATVAACTASLAVSVAAHAQGCSSDINGDGRVDGADLATVLSNWGTCPATISSVSPAQGSVLGGTVITLTGTGLAATGAVTVGGAPCTAVTVLSPTQVRATTPPGSAGEAPIAVTTPAGTSLASQPFTYVMQSVSSISPSSGAYQGGTAITITGQYLAGTTSVTIGGVPATNVVAVSSTTVTAVTPPGSVGAANVVVTGAKGTVTVPGGFTYLAVQTPTWATLLEAMPDPAVVTDASLRAAISATGWAWRVRDNASQIEMLLIPPGTFDMGCIQGSNNYGCYPWEQPVHTVTLTNAYYIGRYEVTQAQWQAKMASNPSYFQGQADSPSRPVEQVSWNTIQGFLSATGLRLPTEAEWEYACRAGTTTPFHSGPGFPNGTTDDNLVSQIAWFNGNSGGNTWPVGVKAANALGVHDMLGNVWEWCNDWYGGYSSAAQTNPAGPASGSNRVVRGGSWNYGSYDVRSSDRYGGAPDPTYNYVGFRVARAPL